jgi:hypothetical protein
MTLRRLLPLLLALAVLPASLAGAQLGAAPGVGPGMSRGWGPWAQPPLVCRELQARRDEQAKALVEAGKRKAGPEEMCTLFKDFLTAESKMIEGLEEHRVTCDIPPGAIKQARAGHAKYVDLSKKICAVAARGPQHGVPWDVPLPAPRPIGDFWTGAELQRLFGQ